MPTASIASAFDQAMLISLLPYALILVFACVAAGLLASQRISDRLVAAGILPRSFLALIPVFQIALRACGILLILAGLAKIASDNNWINPETVSRYGLPGLLILLGIVILASGMKRSSAAKVSR